MALFFAGMLRPPAEAAGIKVPIGEDGKVDENYKPQEYPHWHVYCAIQLGAALPSWDAPWENARIIGRLTDDEVKTVDFNGLMAEGLRIST